MTPRLTSIWKKRAQSVVDYIMSSPGATGKEISYKTGVALSTVHQIIQHDPRAFALAREGKVAVLNRHIKPAWYHQNMTLVPVVKSDRLDVRAEFSAMLDQNDYAPNVRRTLGQMVDAVARGIANPGRSLLRRRRDGIEIVSNAQVIGLGYTALKTENETLIPRLAHIERMVHSLTSSESLEQRYGKPQLRKKPV